MAYSYAEFTIDITDTGILLVIKRTTGEATGTPIDLNQENALLVGGQTSFTIIGTEEDDNGQVYHQVPLVGNDVHINTSGELCNGSSCGDIKGKAVLIKIVQANLVAAEPG